MSMQTLDEKTLNELYIWVDGMPLSKKLRNISKDFSDGVLVAEIIAHYLPRYITLNNFAHVNSASLKRYNWETLDKIVLYYLGIRLSHSTINKLVAGEPGAIEFVLYQLRQKIDEAIEQRRFRPRRHRSRSSTSRASNLNLNQSDAEDFQPQTSSARYESQSVQMDLNEIRSKLEKYQNALNSAQDQDNRSVFSLKDEKIEALYSRIQYLESVVQQKEDRINALTEQVEKLLEIAVSVNNSHPHNLNDTPPSSEGHNSVHPNDISSPFRKPEPYESYMDLK